MKRFVTALLATTMIAGAASAADMSVKARPGLVAPVDMWTGFYIGGNVGYGAAQTEVRNVITPVGAPPGFTLSNVTIDHSLTGFVGGIQGGYNWMLNPTWLVGIEADFQWANQDGAGAVSVFTLNNYTGTQSLNWFGTVRGRIGPIVGSTLWYFTGGFAYGEREARESVSAFVAPGVLLATGGRTISDTVSGWTVGVGAETKLTNNWSVKLEYLYVNLDAISNAFPIAFVPPFGPGTAANSASTANDLHNHVARIGVNYKF